MKMELFTTLGRQGEILKYLKQTVLPEIQEEHAKEDIGHIVDMLGEKVFCFVSGQKTVDAVAEVLKDPRYQNPAEFALIPDEEDLIITRQMDYRASWIGFLAFLDDRIEPRAGVPYNPKLKHNVAKSYAQILMMQAYEQRTGRNMYEILKEAKKAEEAS